MKTKYLTLIMLLFGILSCQNDSHEILPQNDIFENTEDGEKITLYFSLDDQIEQDNRFSPMKAKASSSSTNYNKLVISNYYKILIVKQIGDNWIVEDIVNQSASTNPNSNYVYIVDGSEFSPITLTLRPGNYRIVAFTGTNSTSWNPEIKKGTVIGTVNNNNNFDTPWAVSYKTAVDYTYIPKGEQNITQEIFSGKTEFKVEKSDNLHSYPSNRKLTIPLHRRVGRFDIMLRDIVNPISDISFDKGYSQCILAYIRVADDSPNTICPGLDVWGEPQYRTDKVINRIIYCTYTTKYTNKSPFDGNKYYTTKMTERIFGSHFFTAPGKDVKFHLENINLTHYNLGEEFEYNYTIDNLYLQHNKRNGIVFEPGDGRRSDNPKYRELNLVYTDNTKTTLFDSNQLFDPYIAYNDSVMN